MGGGSPRSVANPTDRRPCTTRPAENRFGTDSNRAQASSFSPVCDGEDEGTDGDSFEVADFPSRMARHSWQGCLPSKVVTNAEVSDWVGMRSMSIEVQAAV